jgi:hypothetical protein
MTNTFVGVHKLAKLTHRYLFTHNLMSPCFKLYILDTCMLRVLQKSFHYTKRTVLNLSLFFTVSFPTFFRCLLAIISEHVSYTTLVCNSHYGHFHCLGLWSAGDKINDWEWSIGGAILSGKKPKFSQNNVSYCHFVHQNPTWNSLGLDLGLHSRMVSFRISQFWPH